MNTGFGVLGRGGKCSVVSKSAAKESVGNGGGKNPGRSPEISIVSPKLSPKFVRVPGIAGIELELSDSGHPKKVSTLPKQKTYRLITDQKWLEVMNEAVIYRSCRGVHSW